MTETLAGLALVAGAILFFCAAFNPSASVFMQPTPARKLAVLRRHPRLWLLSQPLFGGGATLAALGVGLLAPQLRPSLAAQIGYLAAGLLLVGALCWDWDVYRRAVDPTRFAHGGLAAWPFTVYTVLTNLGLLAFGVALLAAGFPSWLGAIVIGGGAVFLVAYLIFRDLPPFLYYVVLGLVGLQIAL
ncbi:MAG: hypothetical protein ACYC4L_22415 [Chloroflexota bacterium]